MSVVHGIGRPLDFILMRSLVEPPARYALT